MSDDQRKSVIAKLLGRERITAEHRVFLTSDSARQVRAAQQALLDAEADPGSTDDVEAAKQRLSQAWRDAEAAIVTLRFEGVEPDVFEELVGAHPATEEQDEKAGGPLRWNPLTFPAALIAATNVEPGFTSAQEAHTVFYAKGCRFSPAEAQEVFDTALQTCQGSRTVSDWGKESGETAS